MREQPNWGMTGKVAIVTGASAGIGEAAARAFGRAGAKVVLAARRAERLERLAEEIRAEGGTALAVPTDVTNTHQIENLVRATMEAYGRIDVLANIAGWGRYDWLEELSAEDLRRQYEVNVIGMAEVTRQVLPVMKAQRFGHILNMCSYASEISIPPLTVYASTKYAVEGLSDGLRRELMPWGIYVTRIHPSGVTGTEFNQQARQDGGITFRSSALGKISRERLADELVKLVVSPRRTLFISRLYDAPVVLNRLFPQVVDLFMAAWVRMKRRTELAEPHPREHPVKYAGVSPGLVMGALIGVVVVWRKLKRR
jgi:NADP-dependent 3-hydroxy acid dehydrogenase YdfG